MSAPFLYGLAANASEEVEIGVVVKVTAPERRSVRSDNVTRPMASVRAM